MKILYVVHQFFPYHHTGTERLTLQLAKQIQKMGHFVSVLTYEANNLNIEGFENVDEFFMKKEYQIESVPVISFKKRKIITDNEVFNPLIEKHIRKIVGKFDLVHFTHPWRLGSVLKICKELELPTILTLTDTWLLCPINLLTINSQLCSGPEGGKKCISVCNYDQKIIDRYQDAKFFFENVDKVFSGSEFLMSVFLENDWKREIKLNTFSVDYQYVRPQGETDEIVFAFLGSLMWHKGLHVLLQAFKKVKNEHIKLKIFGKGAEGNAYSNEVLSLLKDDKRIEYYGTFEYENLPKVMHDISVIIIPSMFKENFPLVMQLALAYTKPVIATRIGGMTEVIKDRINGFLFEFGDVDKLAEIISEIANDPKLLVNLKKNIEKPPRIEEEAFVYENAYNELKPINRFI